MELITVKTAKNRMKWLKHVCRMTEKSFCRRVYETRATGKKKTQRTLEKNDKKESRKKLAKLFCKHLTKF